MATYVSSYASMTKLPDALPDLLRPGLDLVICGTAAGWRSASDQAYYADSRNRFWRILHEVGLTPRALSPEEYRKLLEFDIGLTDLAKHCRGPDSGLRDNDYDIAGFNEKIKANQPRVLLFNGKQAAAKFFRIPTTRLEYGFQKEEIGVTALFVAPSTSGSNGHWKPCPWHDCARHIQGIRQEQRNLC